jgi:2,5-diamino-6-(ribosylamino)-4(3H)-pyrimidinone 5'-phosphate reductase
MSNTERPHVICHMMSTIDGKITGGNGTDILSGEYFDLYTKTEDMLGPHTAWMFGRVTMQMFANANSTPLPSLTKNIELVNYLAPHEDNLFMFGVDTKGLLRWDKNTIKLSNVIEPLSLVIVVTVSTPKEYLQYLQNNGISYLVAGTDKIDFIKLFNTMKEKLGVETLLLEGGGLLNGSVMAADLVDEISLLVTPTVINQSQAPSLFERKQNEPLNLRHYTLTGVKQMDKDTVWLRYKKANQ